MTAKINYKRTVLHKDKYVEVVVITWPKNSRSAAHDHGESSGLIRVLSGNIYQDVYHKKTRRFIERLKYKKGDTLVETPDLIHIMGNASQTKSAQALHIYTPPLKMKVFEDHELKKK